LGSKSLRLTQATTRSLLISAQYCPEFLACQEERARTSRFRTPTRHMYVCISIRPAEKTKGISWTATRNKTGSAANADCLFQLRFFTAMCVPLALSRVPNIAGCEPVVALTPRCLRMRPVVDIHIEVVAKRKAEAIREDVDIAGYKTGEHCLTTSSNHRWLRSDSRRSSAAHCADPSRRSLCFRRLQLRLTGMHG